MSTKTFRIKNYYEQMVPIDDGIDGECVEAGAAFPIRIRRFTVAQLNEFTRGFARMKEQTAARFLFRKPEGDEQAFRPNGLTYVVPQSEIERRRISEMTADTRAAYDRAVDDDVAFNSAFCAEMIAAHIWLPPGVTIKIEQEDGSEVEARDGAGLFKAFCGNYGMLVRLVEAIYEENVLSPEEKKRSRLRSGSTASSSPPAVAAAVDGATPAATVASVATGASVPSGDASADQDPIPSGSAALVGAT